MAELKNPKELVSIVRNQTFAIQNELVKAECQDGAEPLKFYSHFSRFPIVIINTERKAATANIHVGDIPDMVARTNFAHMKDLEMAYMPKIVAPTPTANGDEDLSNNIAFTVVLTLGNGLKGKTPAQLILEDPNNTQKLNNQYKWLKENIDKNPKFKENNLKQMEAIAEAGRLYKAGKLTADVAATASTPTTPAGQGIVIYETGMRPLIRRKRPDGKCFVYEVKIEWVLGNKYPVNVEIQNYYAPVTQDAKGLLNVKASEKSDVVRNMMRLSASDWEYVMYMIQTNMRTFENAMGNFAYKTASDAAKANREKAGLNNHTDNT